MPKSTPDRKGPKLRAGLRSSTALTVALMMGAGTLGGAAFITLATGNAAYANCSANPCAANPCAADNPCAAANPCAVADPCAANPCAAVDPCGPCGPCAAAEGASTGCFVPRLAEASANPCAADPCAANPCAANACAANPCTANPCAADTPCAAANPCAASAPGGPCAAAPPPEVSEAELQALYACLMESMSEQAAMESDSGIVQASWTQSDRSEGRDFATWANFASTPYISFTHGERFATNHANDIAAEQYAMFEDVEVIPAGGIIAKPTFSISDAGEALWETLFLMEKAGAGMSPDTNGWIYTAIMPDGSLMGRTLGQNSDGMYFCAACHMGGGVDTDDLLFMEPEYRVQN